MLTSIWSGAQRADPGIPPPPPPRFLLMYFLFRARAFWNQTYVKKSVTNISLSTGKRSNYTFKPFYVRVHLQQKYLQYPNLTLIFSNCTITATAPVPIFRGICCTLIYTSTITVSLHFSSCTFPVALLPEHLEPFEAIIPVCTSISNNLFFLYIYSQQLQLNQPCSLPYHIHRARALTWKLNCTTSLEPFAVPAQLVCSGPKYLQFSPDPGRPGYSQFENLPIKNICNEYAIC